MSDSSSVVPWCSPRYSVLMRAHLTVALDADAMPKDQKHLRDIAQHQIVEYMGEGADGETAKTAALKQVPDGALKLHWRRDG